MPPSARLTLSLPAFATNPSWIVRADTLLFGHALFQSREAFRSGLLDESHVFPEMLLGVDFPFLPPLLLVQSELRDQGAVFLVQRFPDRRTFGLQKNGVCITGWVGCPCGAPARSQ
jgi:hypothetical protein